MSTPGDSGTWNTQGNPLDAQNGGQDPWAQPPAQQGSSEQAPAQQDAWAHPSAQQPAAPQDPYGQQPAAGEQGVYGQQNPYGQQPAAPQDPYGQASGVSASDPYGQASGASASDPYGQGQQNWSPVGGSGTSASDPYSQSSSGQADPAYGQQGYGQQGAGQAPMAGANGAVPPGEPQSRLVVGLLGIFLGGFGVHRFLLGYTTIGIIQIVVTFITCGIGAWWGLIEGIMVLAKSPSFERDAHGRPLKD